MKFQMEDWKHGNVRELKHLIEKSVKEQMMSDVPLGFFLSGGMDSSVVTASAKNIYKNISAYTIGMDFTNILSLNNKNIVICTISEYPL